MINDTPWGPDKDMGALGKGYGLRHHVDAANQGGALHPDAAAQRLKLLSDLYRKLSSGGQH